MQAANPATPPVPQVPQLLEQLRDIHAAAQPGWWPPAPGWWLLVALALVALAFLLRWWLHRLAVWRRRRAWMQRLDQLDASWNPAEQGREYLAELNRLFRAVALRAFPDQDCARFEGERWVDFIRARLPEAGSAAALGALANGPYQPVPRFDAEALRALARAWVSRHG